ncbi:MAG: hypothetical protein V4671_27195 [Armatimonadota bacterium]
MAEGRKLRWWQDVEQNQAAHSAVERVTLAAKPLVSEASSSSVAEQDTWAELEAEAVRRAAQVKSEVTDSVSFYLDKAVARVRHRREIRNFTLAGIAMFTFSFLLKIIYAEGLLDSIQYEFALIEAFFQVLTSIPALLLHFMFRRRWLRNIDKPVVLLSSLGIHLRVLYPAVHPFRQDVFVSWDDIVDVVPTRIFNYRHLTLRSRKLGRINLPETDLPLPAEALAIRISDYKAAREID